MSTSTVPITCPTCHTVRQMGLDQSKRRKSDVCKACYRKKPFPGVVGRPGARETAVKQAGPKQTKLSSRVMQAVQLVAGGTPISAAAAETHLGAKVIQRAIEQAASLKGLADDVRERIADQWYVLAQVALASISELDLLSATAKDKALIAKIAVDQARVLEGKPTEIVAQYRLVLEKYMTVPTPGTPPSSPPAVDALPADGSLDTTEIVDAELVEMDAGPGSLPAVVRSEERRVGKECRL